MIRTAPRPHQRCAPTPRPCRDELQQPMPVAAAANEAFKAAMALGLGDSDFAAVYEATQAGKKAPTTQ